MSAFKSGDDMLLGLRERGLVKNLPGPLRKLGRWILGAERADSSWWREQYRAVLEAARPVERRPELPPLGIIKDRMLRHSYYEAACQELGVPYEALDISGDDWVSTIQSSDCVAFAVRPFVLTRVGKSMYDDRVRILSEELRKPVIPSLKSLWLYESKSRCSAWLESHRIPSPRTSVIYDEEKALEFVATAEFPLVFKLDIGAGALGVEIVRDRRRACALVRRCFGKGMSIPRHDPRDKQWGFVIFQEFVRDAREWRIIRIGDSYFGHRKGKQGDFHSGTKLKEFERPPRELLQLAKQVTDAGPFDSMALDILEDAAGTCFVLELQAYFGASRSYQMLVDEKPGRLLYSGSDDDWHFEAGDFARNAGCNLRVQQLYRGLGYDMPDDWAHVDAGSRA